MTPVVLQVDRKSTMPMLANVLLRTRGKNQLLVVALPHDVAMYIASSIKSSIRELEVAAITWPREVQATRQERMAATVNRRVAMFAGTGPSIANDPESREIQWCLWTVARPVTCARQLPRSTSTRQLTGLFATAHRPDATAQAPSREILSLDPGI